MRCGTEKKSTNISREDDEAPELETSERQEPLGRHKWTSPQVAELKRAFSSHIVTQSVTIKDVRKTVLKAPALKGIPPKKILDKVRSYFGNNSEENTETPSLPTEEESLANRLKRAGLVVPTINKVDKF
jgi:hypothetical protein